MASATKVSKARRRIRKKRSGKDSKKQRHAQGTPKFPIHPTPEDKNTDTSDS